MKVKSEGNYYFLFKNKDNKDNTNKYGEIIFYKNKKEIFVSNKCYIDENSLSLGNRKYDGS